MNEFEKRKELEQAMKKAGRLPPGQSLTLKFPVLHIGSIPLYDENLADWNIRFFGEVEEEVSFNWQEFMALPRRTMTYDLHCVTRWSMFDSVWEGIHLQDLVNAGILKTKDTAKFVVQHCEYGYTTNTSLEAALADNFILAFNYDGRPLDAEHGYPLRGLMAALPGDKTDEDRYLWKGGKWIRGLEFTTEDKPGFWERSGYNNIANVWREERYGGFA